MKKPKLRLDKAAIQEFVIEHVEKIVFGLLTLIFLFFVYSAIGVVKASYPKTPAQLTEAVTAGQRILDGTEPKTDLVVQDYDVQAKQNTVDVDKKLYPPLAVIDKRILSKPPLRDKPALYAVTGLRGSAGLGAMSMTTEPAAGGGGAAAGAMAVQGLRWIVVTGLVPYDKELAAFDDALRNAGPPGCCTAERDSPYYVAYEVQRLEVLSPADAAKPEWKNAKSINSTKAIADMQKRWTQQQAQEHVAPEHFFTSKPTALVFPLGNLVGSTWNDSVAHPDEIPFVDPQVAGGMAGGAMAPAGNKPPDAGTVKPAGGDSDADDDPQAAPPPGGGGTPAPGPVAAAATSRYLLFRFFDFDVQPGKQYVYRVRLKLRNPNYKKSSISVNPAWLKDPNWAEEQFLKTEWSDASEPAPTISVPGGTSILAVSVSNNKATREHLGRVLVTKWSKKHGVEAFDKVDVQHGSVVDFSKAFKPSDQANAAAGPGIPPGGMMPGGHGMMPPGGMPPGGMPPGGMMPGGHGMVPPGGLGPMGGMRPGPTPAGPTFNGSFMVNYFTRAIIIDLRGGETLHGRRGSSLRLSAPGAMLLQDADGNLVVRDEIDDLPAYDRIAGSKTPEAPAAPTQRPKAAGPGRAPAKGGAADKPGSKPEAPKKTGGSTPRPGRTPKKSGQTH
jgi:hypothetical protein